jgi:type 1 glutamine amidotransferase
MLLLVTHLRRLSLLILAGLSGISFAADAPKVLVYTRNHLSTGKCYVHENIPYCVAALKEVCAEKGIGCDASEDPAVFTAENLKNYGAIIFANSNHEAFTNPDQSKVFTNFVENGGGFVGIHSACGSERKNPEFKRVLGGLFKWHTPNQMLSVVVADPKHPATQGVPATWSWKDEGYVCDMVPGLHVILEMDTTKLADPSKFTEARTPLSWSQQVGKGRSFFTALGHDKEAYADPVFRKHLQGGILWSLKMAD